jgi:hypothetical protein
MLNKRLMPAFFIAPQKALFAVPGCSVLLYLVASIPQCGQFTDVNTIIIHPYLCFDNYSIMVFIYFQHLLPTVGITLMSHPAGVRGLKRVLAGNVLDLLLNADILYRKLYEGEGMVAVVLK